MLAGRLISSSLWYITGRGGLGIFFWWWSKTLVQTRLLDFFVANYFSQRRTRVSQSVNVNSQLGTPKQFFVIFLEFILVAKFKASFIEIISHFKSDIRSCRCENSSIKQASGLIGGLDPPDPPSPLDPPLYQRARPPVFPICKQPLYRPTSHATSFSTLQLRLYSAILNASVDQKK